ncbi:MAG: hypothetical protein H6555_07800 [Lewinellaceae bacterium]|nr:hypothetical protein [Lewinellaceae bacterium]
MLYHIVEYSGPFGFIKPWTAVRDGETFSQQFLTPSIIEGMRQKLGVKNILRHRIDYQGLSRQQEVIQGADYNIISLKGEKNLKKAERKTGIIVRNVLLNPVLTLAFSSAEDASEAYQQHLCLCRNEDIVFPVRHYMLDEAGFSEVPGFELLFGKEQPGAFLVGYNRYQNAEPSYGVLKVYGQPQQFSI